jgi:hypothetical protein
VAEGQAKGLDGRRRPLAAADQRGAIAKAEGWTVSFSEYFAAQADHIQQITQLPVFTKVIMPLDELYRLSLDLVPPSSKPHFGRFLLVCHKAFTSAASTIARGQPDDSQGVTRRACEAARIARATKHRPENLEAWQSYEERLARWHAREKNEKPKPLRPDIQDPPGNEFVPKLMERIGMYSDAAVHFTPEFMAGQSWRNDLGAELVNVNLRYFEPSQEEIQRAFADLAATHVLVLRAFDECYDNAFRKSQEWVQRLNHVSEMGLAFFSPPAQENNDKPERSR